MPLFHCLVWLMFHEYSNVALPDPADVSCIFHMLRFQIRHASTDRLLDRLTDLRFLSIDFLNTFLLTYRVFTTGQTVLDALKRVYRNPEYGNLEGGTGAAAGGFQEVTHR